ncbi:hypothetical protein HDF23_001963 [Mucilaginibacter lappiensis]|uniref:KaiC-like domain-containing protein n=1 Tax=Mucilaginibacter lappiensis TaxID=354630 RepID=A0ABR6PHG9_9SPHI|nr:hypothetical protein [Mucilaginibacter lappiensis]MBB6109220.1 hypothetical protein [Mucilaginibacter lappiensis]
MIKNNLIFQFRKRLKVLLNEIRTNGGGILFLDSFIRVGKYFNVRVFEYDVFEGLSQSSFLIISDQDMYVSRLNTTTFKVEYLQFNLPAKIKIIGLRRKKNHLKWVISINRTFK